jgi:transcriptional regulator with XRE-family HTH domain
MNSKNINIGQQIKSHRKASGMTLGQLSQKAGVSKSMLSQIEHNKINPTLAIIIKISDALKIGIGNLFNIADEKNILRVIPHNDKHYSFRSDKYCNIRTLSPLNLEKSIEFYKITLKSKGKLNSEPHFSGTEEILYLSKGKVRITSDKENVILSKSDSIHYKADKHHCIENIGKGQAICYLIVRYK